MTVNISVLAMVLVKQKLRKFERNRKGKKNHCIQDVMFSK